MGLQFTGDQFSQVGVGFFGKCRDRKALLGWRSILEPLQKRLHERHAKVNIYLGQEFIYTRRTGWRLNRYGSIKALKRMWTLVESGVYNKLMNISYKPPTAPFFEPRRLTIHGNIFVQFVFHSGGLLLALLVFVAELHKKIILRFNSIRLILKFLLKNVLHQSQKAFLQGLRFLLNKSGSNYFIAGYWLYTILQRKPTTPITHIHISPR